MWQHDLNEPRVTLNCHKCLHMLLLQERLIFLALSNYKVNWTKTVRDCCRCTGLMFPASFWLNVGSGCRSHAAYCFHILCSLSNGSLKTGCLLFWPPRLQSEMPWHCFPFLDDRRRCGRRRRRREWNLPPPPLSVSSRRQVTLCWVLMQTLCRCVSGLIQREQREAQLQLLSPGCNQHYCHSYDRGSRKAKVYQPNIFATDLDTNTHNYRHKHSHMLRHPASQPPPSYSPHFSKHWLLSSHQKQKSWIVLRATSWHMPFMRSPSTMEDSNIKHNVFLCLWPSRGEKDWPQHRQDKEEHATKDSREFEC